MDGTASTPPRKRKWAHRGGTCEKHGNACAMRRDVLDPDSTWTCVECEHEAGTLLAPQPSLAPAALSVTEQTPPATPNAVEAAMPADDTERGGGAACSKAESVREMLTRWRNEDASINEAYARACELRDELDRALRRYDYGKLSADALGIELLRISNQLATESKRLRAPESAPRPSSGEPTFTQECLCTHEHGDSDCAKHPTCFRCHKIIGYEHADHRCDCVAPQRDEIAALNECKLAEASRKTEVTPSGGAEALPSGWQRCVEVTFDAYAYGGGPFFRNDAPPPRVDRIGSGWRAFERGERRAVRIELPSAAQAMCAALSIDLDSEEYDAK